MGLLSPIWKRRRRGGEFNPASISGLQQFLFYKTALSGSTVFDESTNKGSARAVQLGWCYNLDGTNDYADYGTSGFEFLDNASNAWEAEFYFNPSNLVGVRRVFTKQTAGAFRGTGVYTNGASLRFDLLRTIATDQLTVSVNGFTPVVGTDYKVKMMYNGNKLATGVTWLINGVSYTSTIVTQTLTSDDVTAATSFKIGTDGSFANYGAAKVWGVKVWDSTGTLRFFARCDEQFGLTSFDSSGYGLHGLLYNTVAGTHANQNLISYQNEVGFTAQRNLLTYSQDFDNAAWTKGGGSITSIVQPDPLGGNMADTFFEDNTTGNHRLFKSFAWVAGTTYTMSCYFKYIARQYVAINMADPSASGTIVVDLVNGTISGTSGTIAASGIEDVGSGWYRAWITRVSVGTGNSSPILYGSSTGSGAGTLSYTGLNAAAWDMFGAVIEVGSMTDYQRNINSAAGTDVPRNEAIPTQDVYGNALQNTGRAPNNGLLKASGCSVVNGTTSYWNVPDNAIFDITNNLSVTIRAKNNSTIGAYSEHLITKWTETGNFREWVLGVNLTQKPYVALSSNGAAVAVYTANDAIVVSNETTYGFTFSSGTVKLYVNGVLVAGAVTTGSIPASLYNGTSPIAIGTVFASGSVNWKGQLFDARIYKDVVLTDAEMLAIHNGTDTTVGATPVAHFPMAETAGNAIYNSVNTVHGIGVNSPTRSTQNLYHANITDGYRRYLNFDGSNDRVNYEGTGVGFNPALGFTFAFFATPLTFTGLDRIIFSINNSANTERVIAYIKSGTFDIGLYGLLFNGGTPVLGSNFTINESAHYAIRYNASTQTVTFWKNGALVFTQTSVTTTLTAETNCKVQIGARYFTGTTQYYNGLLRNVEYFNSALSDADIIALSNNTAVAGSIVDYPLNERTGTTAVDTSGNGFNGTIIGSPDRVLVPAKTPLIDALNAPLANPAGGVGANWHNGCETKLDRTGGVASPYAVIAGLTNDYDFNEAETNPNFHQTITLSGADYRAQRFIGYPTALSGNDLTQIENFTATRAL